MPHENPGGISHVEERPKRLRSSPVTQEKHSTVIETAVEAFEMGYTPIPITPGEKRPAIPQWTRVSYDTADDVRLMFKNAESEAGAEVNIGLALGEASGGLVDVDLDHPKALRLRDLFLPPTAMMSGRAGARRSHYWYDLVDSLPEGTRRYKMPDGSVSVELRSSGGQTLIAPSKHPSGESYRWEGEPFGGEEGPAREHGMILSARVVTLAMACVLVDGWPMRGGRHEAYLALAGGLLRFGTSDSMSVHPLWESALPNLIRALAEATNDEDGPETRSSEVMGSTMERLRLGKNVQGFPTLAKIIGQEHSDLVRTYAREIESILGHATRPAPEPIVTEVAGESEGEIRVIDPENRSPLDERAFSWEPVDMAPYLENKVADVEPGILYRSDGVGLFYPGRVNCLYGRSESGKSWLTIFASKSVIEAGGKVLYLDCEDEPQETLKRFWALGAANDDILHRLAYIRPEDPIARLMVNKWNENVASDVAKGNEMAFKTALDGFQPDLIIVDGLTVLYGLHGFDTNSATDTEKITHWMKSLTDNGRRTVILIDHTAKNAQLGATPLGSQHKVAMIQGTAIQVHPITRPVKGRKGEVVLAVGKDRLGSVRQHSEGDDPAIAAEVILDSTKSGSMVITINPPNPNKVIIGETADGGDAFDKMAEQQDNILAALREDRDNGGTGLSQSALMGAAGGMKKYAQKIVDNLVRDKFIERSRKGNSLTHVLVLDPYSLSE